ncbi:hypothetical protein SAMN05443633_11833 [Chryseobacterium arachidis]|uniref:Uncharacterized protein n=1 Tax=Chryseobacterium arachidis TaxID=1416778 RepID=A0A1M5L3Y8_9FLAO|nr:hypothetical protein SAMN05443633_11833 [Chryseobacterium arachidis]
MINTQAQFQNVEAVLFYIKTCLNFLNLTSKDTKDWDNIFEAYHLR